MKSDELLQINSMSYKDREDISLSTLNILFWMIDDSGLPHLKSKGEGIVLSLFDSVQQAREYRFEIESRQFKLSNLFLTTESNKVAGLV